MHFGIPGVKGANYKAYRVNRAQPTLQTVVQVCKRMNIPSPENCSLSTMRNILLSPTETLAAYGLGSLFESWELRLVERPPEQRIACTCRRYRLRVLTVPVIALAGGPADMLRQALITISFSSTVPEFSALKHKHHRIKVDPYAPLWRVRLCR